jgi:hypothetical protein
MPVQPNLASRNVTANVVDCNDLFVAGARVASSASQQIAQLYLPPTTIVMQADGSALPAGITATQLLSQHILVDTLTSLGQSGTLSLPSGAELSQAVIALTPSRLPPIAGTLFYVRICVPWNGSPQEYQVTFPNPLPVGLSFVPVAGWSITVPPLNWSVYGQSMTLCFQCTAPEEWSITLLELMQDDLND